MYKLGDKQNLLLVKQINEKNPVCVNLLKKIIIAYVLLENVYTIIIIIYCIIKVGHLSKSYSGDFFSSNNIEAKAQQLWWL